MAQNVELEALAKSQADKIIVLEKTCTGLQREKEDVTAGYWRWSN
jgi:hypothetical protein